MIRRPLSSATASLVVTIALLYVMQFLIATGEEIITEEPYRFVPDWVSLKDPPDTPVEARLPDKPDKPRPPPITNITESTETGGIGVEIPAARPVPQAGSPIFTAIGMNDGPLVNIIKVQPQYPVAAATRSLEGTVIVQFDVTAIGTVENVVVVDSTNKIFNKAAIEAAYRFRYKPRIVDGTPYGATGLQQLFRFEMEK